MVGIVLSDIEPEQRFLAEGFAQRLAHILEIHAATSRNVDRRKFFLSDDVGIEMENKFARIGVKMSESVAGTCGRTFFLYVRGVNVAQRRLGEEFLLWRINSRQTIEKNVGFAYQRSFTPEADQLWRATADYAGNDHSVDSP